MNVKIDKTEYVIESPSLPASFDGCRMGFLADLHNNTLGRDNGELLHRIKEARVDYLLCGGDMVVGRYENYEGDHAQQLMKTLSRNYPVYYSIGNHEERAREWEAGYFRAILESGCVLIDNASAELFKGKEKIIITGLSLPMEYYGRWWNKKKLGIQAMEEMIGKRPAGFQILLAHNPLYFTSYAAYGPDLVLSGHVHGGLMIIPGIGGVIAPDYSLFPKYSNGCHKKGKVQMIISRGLGAHTLPIRIHNRPEFVVVTLKKTCVFYRQ